MIHKLNWILLSSLTSNSTATYTIHCMCRKSSTCIVWCRASNPFIIHFTENWFYVHINYTHLLCHCAQMAISTTMCHSTTVLIHQYRRTHRWCRSSFSLDNFYSIFWWAEKSKFNSCAQAHTLCDWTFFFSLENSAYRRFLFLFTYFLWLWTAEYEILFDKIWFSINDFVVRSRWS